MGIIVSITGVTGAGKTTLVKEVLTRMENSSMVESVTTRPRRPSDIKGEYRYVSLELFEQLEKTNSFLWTAEHAGTHYGTMGESIVRIIERDNAVGFMILVPQVLERLRAFLSALSAVNAHIPIFLVTPPDEVLGYRIAERGDNIENIRKRFKESAQWEYDARKSTTPFHFIGNNRPIEETVREVFTLF